MNLPTFIASFPKLQMATDDLNAQCHVTVEALSLSSPHRKQKSEIKPRFELCSESRLQTKSHGWKIPHRAGVFYGFLGVIKNQKIIFVNRDQNNQVAT